MILLERKHFFLVAINYHFAFLLPFSIYFIEVKRIKLNFLWLLEMPQDF